MISAYTDKELQIAAQLAYFTFDQKRMGDITLGQLMKEPSIQKTSLKLAVYELQKMEADNQIDSDVFDAYIDDAQKLLAYELECFGVKSDISQSVAESILDKNVIDSGAFQLIHNLENAGIYLNDEEKNNLFLPDPHSFECDGEYSKLPVEKALFAIQEMNNNDELDPDFYQRYIALSQFSMRLQLEDLGVDKSYSDVCAKQVLDEKVFGTWDSHDAYISDWEYIERELVKYNISLEDIENMYMYDPLYYNETDAEDYIESPYIYLRRNIIKTRKLNEHSESKDASRFHATMDLMNYLADPTGFESETEDYNDNKYVSWEEVAKWKVVDVNDREDKEGFYAVTFEDSEGRLLVAFRGSESFDKWSTLTDWIVSDAGLAFMIPTLQQSEATKYMEYLSQKFPDREWYTTGHSLGGNLAEHALLTAPDNMNVVNAISFDGPGVSAQYLLQYSQLLGEKAHKLIHYQWSWVGGLLYPFECLNPFDLNVENRYYVQTRDYDGSFQIDFDSIDLESVFFVHAPCFLDFDNDGSVVITNDDNYIRRVNYGLQLLSEMADMGMIVRGGFWTLNTQWDSGKLLGSIGKAFNHSDDDEKYEFSQGEEIIEDCLGKGTRTKDEAFKHASRQVNRDPLAIDLGERGIELTTVDDGVYFDLDNNGFAEKTAWIGTEDGFLVLDRNSNGSIDNGGELFGDQVWMSDGYISVSGFDALRDLDSNGDGIIDENDAAFSNLKVWVDASHDGISQEGELKTLGELGIQSISLEVTPDQSLDGETGTLRSESAVVNYTDGTTTKISEFLFNVDTTDTVTGTGENRKNTIGNIPDIMDAIESDESGVLGGLFNAFSNSNNPVEKRVIFTKILFKITGAESIDSTSRGVNIDARYLHVVETFMGRSFMGMDGSEPNSNAASVLNNLYRDIENTCYLKLLMSTSFSDTCNSVLEYADDEGNKVLDLSIFTILSVNSILQNENIDTYLYDMSVFLGCYDDANGTSYQSEFKETYGELSDYYKSILSILDNGRTVLGETGDDTLYGTSGNDLLFAGTGDDCLNGGTGNDAYYFKLGDGHDTIVDAEYSDTEGRADKIVFGEGINADDIEVDRYGNDLYINYSDNDGIVVRDAYNWYSSDGRNLIESIEFADGTVWGLDKINREAEIREGSDGNDVMNGYWAAAGCAGNETLHGRGGDDVIRAYDGDDTVYGDEGNDEIYGESGNDTIIGGTGNDYLEGGIGNDTYIFNLGDGRDTIIDAEYSYTEGRADKIVFGEGISADDIVVDRYGNDLYINYSDNDGFVVRDAYNWYSSDGRNLIESIEFADGTVWDLDKINREAEIREGSDGNDVMNGYWAAAGCTGNETIHGRAGDDVIRAYDGDDTVYGDEGNDEIYGESGNDTIIGGTGNDYLEGGIGNDTYIFNLGDGRDTIIDAEYSYTEGRADKIVFGEGISADDIVVDRYGNDLYINYSDDDGFVVRDAYNWYSSDGRNLIESIEFADGTVWDLDKINREAEIREGSDGNDVMNGYWASAGCTGNETLHGRGGNDTIYASDGNDILYGDEGNDNLYGQEGDDTIIGGVGNDYLEGGNGNDTYIFNLGDGSDSIVDVEYSNTLGRADKIVFGEDINAEDIIVDREGDHLKIRYSDDDTITVQDAYYWYSRDGRNFVENIEFADGTIWDSDKINREAEVREGSGNNDTMWGYGAASGYTGNETLYGRGGNDTIYASDGNDILYGDEGNDNLYGQEGDDTIIGGVGNDYLEGGNGNDTYIFNLGDGRDTINDSQFSSTEGRADKIIFGEGISADDIRVNREGDHLKIRYSDDDTITVQDAYYWYSRDGRNQVELVEFKDDSLYRINYDSTTLDFVESLRVEPEVDEDDVEEGANEVEIDFMVSAVEELMDESSVDDTIVEDIIVSESSIDTMVNLIIQDMSENPSGNVGSSDDLFEESSSGEYDQLWVVNE